MKLDNGNTWWRNRNLQKKRKNGRSSGSSRPSLENSNLINDKSFQTANSIGRSACVVA